MKLTINGSEVEVSSSVETVSQLIESYGLQSRVVIVELNKEILQKEDHEKTTLKNGDQLEVVSFVGGG